jgi:hypothetical protein
MSARKSEKGAKKKEKGKKGTDLFFRYFSEEQQ